MSRALRSTVIVVLLAVLAAVPAVSVGARSPASGSAHPSAPVVEPPSTGGHLLRGVGHRVAVASAYGARPARSTQDRVSRLTGPRRMAASGLAPAPEVVPGVASTPASSPSYAVAPAPMGISDLGVGASGPYTYGTTSFEGELNLTSFAAFTPTNLTNLSYPTPDWVQLELDVIAVNVTLPPASPSRSNGTFWVENFLHFNGTSIQLEDNIWNLTANNSEALPPSTLQGHGAVLDSEVYDDLGPHFSVAAPSPAAPLAIRLFDNITLSKDQTVVSFGFSAGPGHSGTYDTVTFNGNAPSSQPQFLVDGAKTTPQGLFTDAEFVLGGNGQGTNANVVALNGNASLLRLTSSYGPVPSAFDFGENSYETALGVAVAYSGTTARLTAGPSFLVGLWNTAGPSAIRLAPSALANWVHVAVNVSPSYAFVFATDTAAGWTNYSFAPTNLGGTLVTDLPPLPVGQQYVFTAWADGWDNQTVIVTGTGGPDNVSDSLALPNDPSRIDAPVYLRGADQVVAFAGAHMSGTAYAPALNTLWINASDDALAAPFLRLNDADYPTFFLLATLGVNVSLDVNGFLQAPTTYNYTTEAGHLTEFLGLTQGYFFYGGRGQFTVQNSTIEGVSPLASVVPGILPPSTVEFYHVSGGGVRNLTVNYDAVGAFVLDSSSISAAGLQVLAGGVGVLAVGSSQLTVLDSAASGYDPLYGYSSTVLSLNATSSVSATTISANASAQALESQGGGGVTVSGLTVATGATALLMNDTGSSSVSDLIVKGNSASAGQWSNSSGLTISSATVNGVGLILTKDATVTVEDATAVGMVTATIPSTVVANFSGSSHGTFEDLSAINGGLAAFLTFCASVNVSGVSATNGSIGAYIGNATSVSGTGFTGTGGSIGLVLNNLTVGKPMFSSFSASNVSLGVWVGNSSSVRLLTVDATNATLGATTYLASGIPVAGVGLYNVTGVTLTGVSATNYPFAVWSEFASGVTISQVTDWYGEVAVLLNWTNQSKVQEVFAFANQLGLSVQNCSGTTVEASTVEVSLGPGLQLADGDSDIIEDNNFVGNDGSSVDGRYNASFLQAWANDTATPSFHDNYWSDRSSSNYVINATVPEIADGSPRSSFYGTYLEFYEQGLPKNESWSVLLDLLNYTMNVSVLYIPGWSLANGEVSFLVSPLLPIPHPEAGDLSWTGSSLSQPIVFGTLPSSSSPSALPGREVLIVCGVAAVVVVAGLLYLWQRRRRPPRGRPGPSRPAPGTRRPRPGEEPDWLPQNPR